PGTAKAKIGWLMDYHGVGDTAWYTNISFGVDYSKEGHTHTKASITDLPDYLLSSHPASNVTTEKIEN
ncbi:MAG: hypothetical protein PHF25_09195, partial [Candidatus Margulisbacteria bacterium]|nr:hypothetical protein [Candidatus Margulisiibacteriota bacterium]